MSSPAIACPHCRVALRSSRPLPENKKVRCPQCGTSFRTPSSLAPLPFALSMEPLQPASSSHSPLGIAALFAGVFILGGMAVAGVYFSQPTPPASPIAETPKATTAKDDKPKAKEDRQAEERRQREQEQKRLTFERLMHKAEMALTKERFADAEDSYREALKMFPDDAAAKKGLNAATSARRAAANAKAEKEKRQAEIAQLREQGKKAMDNKEFVAAAQAYAQAKQLAPDDEPISKALEEARAAVDAEAADKKKLADYQKHLDAGRAALNDEHFAEAVRELQAALNLRPGDAEATTDLKTAQNRLATVADATRKEKYYADLLRDAQAALDAKRPDRAVPFLKEAVKLFPDEKETRRLLKKSMRDAAMAQGEYNRLMAQGDAAMSRQRFEEAKRLYAQAAEMMPDDAQATTKAQAADKALTDFATTRARYDALMLQAAVAMRQLQYAEAITVYNQALQLIPNDVRATQLLIQVKYNRALTAGRIALAQNRLREAIGFLEEALGVVPDDAAATALLTQARLRAR
jgi:tetratricopeptide (TPR) repeat protein